MSVTAIKAYVPRDLKRRAFAALALQDSNFSRWAREQLEAWLQTQNEQPATNASCEDNSHE